MLGLRWQELSFEPAKLRADFVPQVVAPLRALAGSTLDRNAVLGGVFLPGTVGEHVAQTYDKALFKGATLQDLPPEPRFVINATNVQSGALWRFSRPYMGDYRVGRVANPGLKLAVAVAASSAFPPVLSPLTIDLTPFKVEPDSGSDLNAVPFTSRAVLSDGGVYDNLGIETVWKRFKAVLVSDAGQQIVPEPEPHSDWARHSYRVFGLVDNQVRALRKRQVIASFEDGSRQGAYWGISGVAGAPGTPLPCPPERTHELARIPTRLARLELEVQERLINWGYAAADFGLRTRYKTDLAAPAGFPYPVGAV